MMVRSDGSFPALRGKRVFLTGHTGFKGAWLSLWLERLGAVVTGYALRPPTEPSLYDLARVGESLEREHFADLRDRDTLRRAVAEAQPDVILHLAAQSVVRAAYRDPYESFDVNVMGTASLLEAARHLGSPCAVVVVTTDKCYENHEHVWGYRECDAMGGHDPYSASKGACEVLVSSYRRSFFEPAKLDEHGVALASARAGNVIGGGDFTEDALIPDLARSLFAGVPLSVRSPNAVRPWQHVLDCLSGYLTLAERMVVAGDAGLCDGWNFGPLPGNELPVRSLVETFLQEWGTPANGTGWIDASDPRQPHEAKTLRLCIDKALWELRWRPHWSVEEAVRYTARWFQRWQSGDSPRELCMEQIEAWAQATQREEIGDLLITGR